MKFSDLLKSRQKYMTVIDKLDIDLMTVSCQYNPDRVIEYRQAAFLGYKHVERGFLSLRFSPHVWYALRYYQDRSSIKPYNPYSYMQLLYGRNAQGIQEKVKRFNKLLDSVQKEGIKETPIVVISPFVDNVYNQSYEIYEGHHRLAAWLALGNSTCKVKLCTNGLEETGECC